MPDACNFIKKGTLAQVFSCEFNEISKNTFLHRTPLVVASINTFKSNLKFSFECDRNSTNFLDPNVKLNNGGLTTSIYKKPTDRHQYLHNGSSHPAHIKRSTVYSKTLRASPLYSFKEDFADHSQKKTLK